MFIENSITGERIEVSSSDAARTLNQQTISVGTIAVALPSIPLRNRKSILVQNLSSTPIWIGSITVTATGPTRGIVLASQFDSLSFDVTDSCYLYGIVGTGSADLSILESA